MALINIDRCPYPAPLSVKIAETSAKDLVNGMLLAVKEAKTAGEQELYDGKKPAKGDRVAILAQPFHPYDSRDREEDMKFKENDIVRVYELKRGDAFTVDKKACIKSGTAAVGDKLKIGDNYQFEKDSTGADAIAIVTREYKYRGQDSVRIEIL